MKKNKTILERIQDLENNQPITDLPKQIEEIKEEYEKLYELYNSIVELFIMKDMQSEEHINNAEKRIGDLFDQTQNLYKIFIDIYNVYIKPIDPKFPVIDYKNVVRDHRQQFKKNFTYKPPITENKKLKRIIKRNVRKWKRFLFKNRDDECVGTK
mgnify:CR=1 FL=1